MAAPLVVLSIVGTRPEVIKMAPVVRELERRSTEVRSVVVSTGQHREMAEQVMRSFGIRPAIDLGLMQPNQSLSQLTAALFTALDTTFNEVKPDWVVAQGDTTTVLVASLVSFYRRLKFAHVEAGLRSGDKWKPFPEEINRRVADIAATAFFAPTQRAADNLVREGHDPATIFTTGNTVVDALLQIAEQPFDLAHSSLPELNADRLVLVTAHRRESFGEPFRELCMALRTMAQRYAASGVQFVYPVHLNPNVRTPVRELLSGVPNLHLIEPVSYVEMVQLMRRACLVLTDSGGIQEEAPSFGVPVLVMRDTTERPEGVEAGVAKLVGTSRARIEEATSEILDGRSTMNRLSGVSPYGDGKAARRIVDTLLAWT